MPLAGAARDVVAHLLHFGYGLLQIGAGFRETAQRDEGLPRGEGGVREIAEHPCGARDPGRLAAVAQCTGVVAQSVGGVGHLFECVRTAGLLLALLRQAVAFFEELERSLGVVGV